VGAGRILVANEAEFHGATSLLVTQESETEIS
jgi:hypothetical protein